MESQYFQLVRQELLVVHQLLPLLLLPPLLLRRWLLRCAVLHRYLRRQYHLLLRLACRLQAVRAAPATVEARVKETPFVPGVRERASTREAECGWSLLDADELVVVTTLHIYIFEMLSKDNGDRVSKLLCIKV